ncbi:MAG: putative flippase GtrA [Verrucomicrobiales bacterium]|jgi:putative flippase GtrA
MTRRLRLFVAVALIATAIDFAGYLLLQESGFSWWSADIAVLVLAAIVGVSLHRRFTLRNDPNLRWIHRPVAFISSITIAGAVDLLVLYSADDRGWSAKAFAIAAAAVVRAMSNRWFLFRIVKAEQGSPARRPTPSDPLRLSVVVPAYKEAERISSTIHALHGHLSTLIDPTDFEILVIDDGSDDGTADAASLTGLAQGIQLPENVGKGGAVRAGMLAAQGRSRIFLDADLAYGPAEIIRLMAELENGWDVVVGSRRDSRLVTQTSAGLLRDVGGRLVNLATHLLLLGQYRDTQAGCKGFRSDVAELIFEKTKLNGFSFDIEIFHLVERWRLTLREVPMTIAATDASTVNVVRDTFRLLVDLGRIRRWSARGEYTDPERVAMLPHATLPD